MTSIDIFALRFLFVSVLLLPFAIKSITALLGLVAVLALLALIARQTIKFPDIRPFYFVWAFLAFAAASYLWTHTPAASGEALAKLGGFVLGFMIILFWLKNINIRESDKTLLAKILAFAIATSLLFGLWGYYTPHLNTIAQVWGYADFASIFGYAYETVRQTNRALSTSAVLAFILAAFYAPRYPRRVAAALATALIIAAVSQSQSATLALLLGLATFAVATFSARFAAGLMVTALVAGTITIVPLTKYSYTNDSLNAILPAQLITAASINYRHFLYYVYAEEISDISDSGAKLFFGHGAKSGHNFTPDKFETYKQTLTAHPAMQPVANYYQQAKIKRLVHPHQLFLQIIFNFGIIGAALFLLAFAQALKYLLANTPAATHKFYLAAIAALIGIYIFDISIWRGWANAIVILIFILSYLLHNQKENA